MTSSTPSKRWYVVRTYSGHENKVKVHLEQEAKLSQLAERITNVMVPSEKIIEMKDGKKKSKTKTFFPGYILVEAVLDKETKHLILNTPSVLGFIGPKGEPVALQPDEVRRLIGKMEERKEVEVMAVPFHVGEPVNSKCCDFHVVLVRFNAEPESVTAEPLVSNTCTSSLLSFASFVSDL